MPGDDPGDCGRGVAVVPMRRDENERFGSCEGLTRTIGSCATCWMCDGGGGPWNPPPPCGGLLCQWSWTLWQLKSRLKTNTNCVKGTGAKKPSGAQPTKPLPQYQFTQAGPHVNPGTQTQPIGAQAHRP